MLFADINVLLLMIFLNNLRFSQLDVLFSSKLRVNCMKRCVLSRVSTAEFFFGFLHWLGGIQGIQSVRIGR